MKNPIDPLQPPPAPPHLYRKDLLLTIYFFFNQLAKLEMVFRRELLLKIKQLSIYTSLV